MQLTVSKVEKKTTKSGKSYTMVNGKYYCWNEKLVFEQGGTYEVEIEEGQYPKVLKATKLNTQPATQGNGFQRNGGDNRDKTMLLAYAKDIALKVIEKSEITNPYQAMVDALKVVGFSYHALSKLLENQEKGFDFISKLQVVEDAWKLKDTHSILEDKKEEPDPEEEEL
jgi:hypothetical protein